MSKDIHSWGPFGVSDRYSGERRSLYVFGFPIWLPWPIARSITSSEAVVLGYPVYGGAPVWIDWLAHKVFRPSVNALWAFRHRYDPRHRYNLVRTGLEPGYYDYDTRMLHACFALLGEYIEEEGGIEAIRTNGETIHVFEDKKRDVVVSLWDWWKIEKPADEKRRDEMMHQLFGKPRERWKIATDGSDMQEYIPPEFSDEEEKRYEEFRELEQKIDADEQKMLHQLIDIRESLWA